jgi:putative hydrolase of the HAD superfamily
MTRIKAVTLDAAGTLIRVRRPVGETYARIAREHGIPADAEDIGRAFRTVFPRMSPLAFGTTDRETLERQERSWWQTLVRGCLGRHGQHAAFGACFSELYAYYGGAGAWALYPEVPALLQSLDEACVQAAVVSNFDTRLHGVLEQLGVHGRFRTVLCSTEVGAAKPDPHIFQAACTRLRTDPAHTLHVGDDRRADLLGARQAGLQARWVRRGEGADAADDAIRDLSAVSGLVRAHTVSAAPARRNS